MNQMLKKGKHKVHLRWNNLMQQQRPEPVWLDSSSTENILEDHGGQVEHECVDYDCSRKTSKKSKVVVFFPFTYHLGALFWNILYGSGPFHTRQTRESSLEGQRENNGSKAYKREVKGTGII